jgi:hypothetical protein
MARHQGILLTTSFDLNIVVKKLSNGQIKTGFTLGSTIDQEVATVLKLNKGDLKEDPLLGPGLNKFIRGKLKTTDVEHLIRQQLSRVGIDFDDYKDKINANIK